VSMTPEQFMFAATEIAARAPVNAELSLNKVGHLSLRLNGRELAIVDLHDGSVEWLTSDEPPGE
jgi:hypothetical protein